MYADGSHAFYLQIVDMISLHVHVLKSSPLHPKVTAGNTRPCKLSWLNRIHDNGQNVAHQASIQPRIVSRLQSYTSEIQHGHN
jgi:hypothetical protein